MRHLMLWSGRHPRLSLALALLISLGFSSGLYRLAIDASLDTLISGTDQRIRYLKNVTENFKGRPIVLVLVRSPRLFSNEMIRETAHFAEELASIEGVVKSSSIFNVMVPRARGGVAFAGKILPSIPGDEKELAEVHDELLSNSIVRDHLLNKSGDTLGIVLFLEHERRTGGSHDRILDRMREIRERFLGHGDESTEVVFLGIPVVKAAVWDRLNWDLRYLGPLSLAVIASLIYLFYRSFTAMLLPLLTGTLSSLATLGFMGYAGYPVNIFLSSVVVFNLVLGCTEDLHILSEFNRNIARGLTRLKAIERIGIDSGHALLLTSSTTAFGFLSMAFTDNLALRNFAFSCGFAMAVNFIITILTLPALLALLPPAKPGKWLADPTRGAASADGFILRLRRRRLPVLLLGAALLFISMLGIRRMEINSNYFEFCPRDSEAVRANRFSYEHFGGSAFLTVTFETGRRDGILLEESLRNLYLLHEFLNRECGSALGWVNYVNEFQACLGRPLPSSIHPPRPADLIAFQAAFPENLLEEFIDFDRSRTAIRLKARATGSKESAVIESRILGFAAANLSPDVEVRITGEGPIIDRRSDALAEELFWNLALLCAATAALIAISVRSWKQGLVFLVPNLFPIAAIFGAMGWLGIPLSLGTCPVALVVFGIAVDDTIHLILRYNRERQSGLSGPESAAKALHRELHPIVATSVVVTGGILVVVFCPAPIYLDVGILFVIGISVALAADVLLTPLLIALCEGRRSPSDTAASGPPK